jgi:protein deglycase
MEKSALVPVADGTEELEAVAIIDVLRRAGAAVTVASVSGNRRITASRGVVIIADTLIQECVDKAYDLVALPGGIPGAQNLRDAPDLIRILKHQQETNKPYGAICASPAIVLDHHGLLEGHRATCHPGFVNKMDKKRHIGERVVLDGNCLTGRGAGTAVEFALALVERLYNKEKREEVAVSMAL